MFKFTPGTTPKKATHAVEKKLNVLEEYN